MPTDRQTERQTGRQTEGRIEGRKILTGKTRKKQNKQQQLLKHRTNTQTHMYCPAF